MKFRLYIFILTVTLLFSCHKENTLQEGDLTGEWKLIELLIDPGDGSGQFEPTDLDITLEFDGIDKIYGNGILCGFRESEALLEGTYNFEDNLITTECTNETRNFHLEIDNNDIIISGTTCREACRAKFQKL